MTLLNAFSSGEVLYDNNSLAYYYDRQALHYEQSSASDTAIFRYHERKRSYDMASPDFELRHPVTGCTLALVHYNDCCAVECSSQPSPPDSDDEFANECLWYAGGSGGGSPSEPASIPSTSSEGSEGPMWEFAWAYDTFLWREVCISGKRGPEMECIERSTGHLVAFMTPFAPSSPTKDARHASKLCKFEILEAEMSDVLVATGLKILQHCGHNSGSKGKPFKSKKGLGLGRLFSRRKLPASH